MSNALSQQNRLLDVAEALFADSGFHGVSIREMTQTAGLRVAAINDHFGSKERLFEAVIARRATLINQDRQALLDQIHADTNGQVNLQQVIDAFALPLLQRSRDSEGWKNYLRLIAQMSTSRSAVLLLIASHFNPIAIQFIQMIGRAVPRLNQRQQLIAYQLMLSSVMSLFADNHRIDVISSDTYSSADFAQHYHDMTRYVLGGILAMSNDKSL